MFSATKRQSQPRQRRPGSSSPSTGSRLAVMAFTVADGRIVGLDTVNDPDRLARLDIAGLPA